MTSDNAARTPCGRPLWLDGVISSDYELDTLPLLFAAQSDFELYYSTLITKHPSKTRELLRIKKFNLTARWHRDQSNATGCLQILRKCVHLRRCLFDDVDYQYYAALLHYLLSILYFASYHLANGENAAAYELFTLAKKALEEDGQNITKSDNHLLHCILNTNWGNYWYRRGKVNAANQCCCKAYQHWMRITDINPSVVAFFAPFLVARFAASLILSQKYDDAVKVYSKFLQCLPPDGEEDTGMAPAESEGGLHPTYTPSQAEETTSLPQPPPITVNITTLSLVEPTATSESPQENPGRITPSKCSLRSLSISLTPIPMDAPGEASPYATNWSLMKSAKFVSTYNYGYAKIKLRQYRQAVDIFEKAASMFNTFLEGSGGVAGNQYWWVHLQRCYQRASVSGMERTLDDYKMKSNECRENNLLSLQKCLTNETMKGLQRRVNPRAQNRMEVLEGVEGGKAADEDEEEWQKLVSVLERGGVRYDPVNSRKYYKSQNGQQILHSVSIRTLVGSLTKRKKQERVDAKATQAEALRRVMTKAEDEPEDDESNIGPRFKLRRPNLPPREEIYGMPAKFIEEIQKLKVQQKAQRREPIVTGGFCHWLPGTPPNEDEEPLPPPDATPPPPVPARALVRRNLPAAPAVHQRPPEEVLNDCLLDLVARGDQPEEVYQEKEIQEEEEVVVGTTVSAGLMLVAAMASAFASVPSRRESLPFEHEEDDEDFPSPQKVGQSTPELPSTMDQQSEDEDEEESPRPHSETPALGLGGMRRSMVAMPTTQQITPDVENDEDDDDAAFIRGGPAVYSTVGKKSPAAPVSTKPFRSSLLSPLDTSIGQKDQQQKLRSLLGYLEPHSAQYGMVMKELREIEARMKARRDLKAKRQVKADGQGGGVAPIKGSSANKMQMLAGGGNSSPGYIMVDPNRPGRMPAAGGTREKEEYFVPQRLAPLPYTNKPVNTMAVL